MSVLNVCQNEIAEGDKYKNTMTVPEHKLALYRRLAATSSTGSSLSSYSSSQSSLEFFFFRLLDALIFTSAIAITAYGFLTGTLDQQPPLMDTPSSPPKPMIPLRNNKKQKSSVLLFNSDNEDERRRRRTQEWADDQHHQIFPSSIITETNKKRHSSPIVMDGNSSKVQLPSSPKHVDDGTTSAAKKQRTKSMCELPVEKQNERLSRLEEQIHSLIEQGQAALTSPTGIPE